VEQSGTRKGHTRHGKQQHQWKACERQLSASIDTPIIAHERRTLIENVLRERISLREGCRAMGVSLPWLLHFMVECCAACPDHLPVLLPTAPSDMCTRARLSLLSLRTTKPR